MFDGAAGAAFELLVMCTADEGGWAVTGGFAEGAAVDGRAEAGTGAVDAVFVVAAADRGALEAAFAAF